MKRNRNREGDVIVGGEKDGSMFESHTYASGVRLARELGLNTFKTLVIKKKMKALKSESKKRVVALHFTNECNFNCSFCYVRKGRITLDIDFMKELPEYLGEITEQVALGGGEPLLFPKHVKAFARECGKYNLICNITTNGSPLLHMDRVKVKSLLRNVTMLSLSTDSEHIKQLGGLEEYLSLIGKLIKCDVRLGVNLLIRDRVPLRFISHLFSAGVERVFALTPKNILCGDILAGKPKYLMLSMLYPHFYVDDLSNMILSEDGYGNWNKPCHYGKDILSFSAIGSRRLRVNGCSFDSSERYVVSHPDEILGLSMVDFEERHSCPYLNVNPETKALYTHNHILNVEEVI